MPQTGSRARALAMALPLMRRAARAPVKGGVDRPDPFGAVQSAVREGDFDEIIVSTLPARVSKWLRRDLVTRVERLGLPVTALDHRVVMDWSKHLPGG